MRMSRGKWLVPMLAALISIACEPSPEKRLMVGQTESDRIELTAQFAEPILERAVAEGEAVEAGQLILRQDPSRINARIEEAGARVEQAEARLAELTRGPRREQITAARAEVSGAARELEFRETDLHRVDDLSTRGLASQELLDRARLARDEARASLASLEARLQELLSGTTVEELRQAEAAVRLARAQRQQLEIDRDRHAAVAPLPGVVDTLLFEPGERPGVGQPVAILLAGSQAYARVYVPEELRVRVTPGVSARIHVDGLDEPLQGVVRWVSSDAAFTPYFALTEQDRGRLAYVAKIDIVGAGRRIPDGIPVQVEMLLDENGG